MGDARVAENTTGRAKKVGPANAAKDAASPRVIQDRVEIFTGLHNPPIGLYFRCAI